MKKTIIQKYPHMLHGGDYNPDQWQAYPDILKEDMRLFKLANCNEMTLGVFAWATLEPKEGEFDFSFLDSHKRQHTAILLIMHIRNVKGEALLGPVCKNFCCILFYI